MIHRFFFDLLRVYVWAGLHVFYRHIKITGARQVPTGAVLFTANHQNAFMDALLVVCSSGRYTHFLARADIFKKGWAKMLLWSINILPVYRVRDGWQSLGQNHSSFQACARVLQKQQAVVIFPEGNHGSARYLRPLSKGFTRVAFEALRVNPRLPLHIVPVGLNYSHPTAARSAVHVIYGTALNANQFFEMGEVQGAKALREALRQALQPLITHLPEEKKSLEARWKDRPVDFLQPGEVNAWIGDQAMPLPMRAPTPDAAGMLLRTLFLPFVLVWYAWDAKIKDRVFVASLKFAYAWVVASAAIVLLLLVLVISCIWR